MTRRTRADLPRRRVLAALALLVGALGLHLAPAGGAASPARGTLSFAHPRLVWHEASPMVGSAPAVRRVTCSEPTACDDFALTVDRGRDASARMELALVTSAGSQAELVYYPPGCPVTPTSTCYQQGASGFALQPPQNGRYTIRVTCTACAAPTTYRVTATLRHVATPPLPALGSRAFGWQVRPMPGLDAKGTAPTYYGEPGISVNRRGDVIVNTFGPTVWVSHDDGRTFSYANENVDPTPCQQESGDADAVAAFDGTLYADNLCLAGPSNLSFTSRDGGRTWNAGRAGLPSLAGLPDSDRQWYTADPKRPGRVYLSYHDLQGPNITVARSDDYGQTWTQLSPVTVAASNYSDSAFGNTTARMLVDPRNPDVLTLVYSSNAAAKSATAPPTNKDFDLTQVDMARSTDGGLTWTNALLYDAGTTEGADNTIAHLFPSAAVDDAGNVYIGFSERLGGRTRTHVELGVVPSGTMRMTKPVQVDTGTGANVFPWVTAGERGRVAISWYGSLAKDNDDPHAVWAEMVAESVDALGGRPHFAQSRVSGPMHEADICLAGTLCLVTNGNRNLSDFQGVDVDPCGFLQLVWTDDHSGQAVTMHGRQTRGPSLRPHACRAR